MFRVLMNRSLALALLSLFVATAVLQADDRGRNRGKGQSGNPASSAQAKVEGTITVIGANTVIITNRAGVNTTVGVDATTKVERNDRRVSLSAFKAGDRGQALFNPATMVASKVEATGP